MKEATGELDDEHIMYPKYSDDETVTLHEM